MMNLTSAVRRYRISNYRDDKKLADLDSIDFIALIWTLRNGHFDLLPFSTESFFRFVHIGDNSTMEFINSMTPGKCDRLRGILVT